MHDDPKNKPNRPLRKKRRKAAGFGLSVGLIAIGAVLLSLYFTNALTQTIIYSIAKKGWITPFSIIVTLGLVFLVGRTSSRNSLALILAASFCAQMGWSSYAVTTPISDFSTFYQQARLLSADMDLELLHRSKSPITALIYAGAFKILGDSLFVVWALGALLWTLQAGIIWKIATLIPEISRRANIATLLMGLMPSTIIYSGAPSSEAVFGLLSLLSFLVLIHLKRKNLALITLSAGLFIALAFLSRPIAIAHLGAFVIFCIFCRPLQGQLKKQMAALSLVLTSFFITLSPQIALNLKFDERLSISPSRWSGYNLLAGTNRAHDGGYNTPDLEAAGYTGPNAVPWQQADKNARKIARDRIISDPIGFIKFALTDKMRRLWRADSETLSWSLNGSPKRSEIEASGQRWLFKQIADGAYMAFIITSLTGLLILAVMAVRRRISAPGIWISIVTIILLLATMHIFVEVRERYHMTFFPWMCLLTSLTFDKIYKTLKLS